VFLHPPKNTALLGLGAKTLPRSLGSLDANISEIYPARYLVSPKYFLWASSGTPNGLEEKNRSTQKVCIHRRPGNFFFEITLQGQGPPGSQYPNSELSIPEDYSQFLSLCEPSKMERVPSLYTGENVNELSIQLEPDRSIPQYCFFNC